MRSFLGWTMLANAALFMFGAVQHAGIEVGPFREPRIIPATIVESVCGALLAWGALAVLTGRARAGRAAFVANLVALGGVLIGIAALAAGAGPRSSSNDLYHLLMLVLISIALSILAVSMRHKRLA